ncbi:MAG: flagellar type III secretion system pore protein FliP [Candidatus Eremiobacteraeota bacterium]|nr:flagellar type III secretion system pore protein FliP [Candidatus Eremiobacteraeota bacterium]
MSARTGRWLGIILLAVVLVGLIGAYAPVQAQNEFPSIEMPKITIDGAPQDERAKTSSFLQIMFFLTTLTLAPYILIMSTAFIRTTITLSFLRTALGTQQVPSTQVLMGLALFITMYVMAPVGIKMNKTAIQPYLAGTIEQPEFVAKLTTPPRQFMLLQCRDKDLILFLELSQQKVESRNDAPIYVLLPAFVLSEIKTAFEIGFLLYLPFLVIDMIVASVLMSMGMFMLSPMTISLPFKLLMFVMIDGWHLIIKGLVKSFHMENMPP